MNKRTLNAFAIGFLVSFLILGGGTGLLWLPDESGDRAAALALIAVVSALQAVALAYSVYRVDPTDESFVFADEVVAGVGAFGRSLALLRLRGLRPLWISALVILVGFLILSRISIFGALLICTGQIGWFSARARVRDFVENNKAVPVLLADYVLWLSWAMDAFAVLITALALAKLRLHGETESAVQILAVSFVLALLGIAYFYRAARRRPDLLLPIKALLGMLWVVLLLTTVDYGFDVRLPRKVTSITYRDCPEPGNRYFTVGNVKIEPSPVPEEERFAGCEYFYRLDRRPADTEVVEVLHHPGAIGIAWKQPRFR